MEEIPLDDSSVDVVISNGVIKAEAYGVKAVLFTGLDSYSKCDTRCHRGTERRRGKLVYLRASIPTKK